MCFHYTHKNRWEKHHHFIYYLNSPIVSEVPPMCQALWGALDLLREEALIVTLKRLSSVLERKINRSLQSSVINSITDA